EIETVTELLLPSRGFGNTRQTANGYQSSHCCALSTEAGEVSTVDDTPHNNASDRRHRGNTSPMSLCIESTLRQAQRRTSPEKSRFPSATCCSSNDEAMMRLSP